jgi:DNA-binding NarL/FixJ family response regulator
MLNADPIKVLVIHNNPIARAGLAAGFKQYHDIELVDADDSPASSFVQPSAHSYADVVVTDYDAGMAMIERCRCPQHQAPLSKIMIVTPSDRESDIRHALERGARGYMLLDSEFDDLAHGVRDIHMGVRALSRRIAQQLAESMTGEQLSARELEVLRLVVDGHGNKIIARRLEIALGTVKSHMKSIFDKLQVLSRTQAIAVAERRGLLAGSRNN